MEQKNIKFLIKAAVISWLFVAGGIGYFSYHLNQLSISLQELGQEIDGMRVILSIDRPYVSHRSNQLLEKYVEIDDLSTEIKTHAETFLFSPDIKQLLYKTSDFLDNLFKFLDVHLQTIYFSEQNRLLQQNTRVSPELKHYYYQVEALVFQSMNSGVSRNPDIYRGLERVYQESKLLPVSEQTELRQDLVVASQLIESYASRAHAVDSLVEDSVFDEIARVKRQFYSLHRLLFHLVLISSCVVVSVIGLLAWFLSRLVTSDHLQSVMSEVDDVIKPGPVQTHSETSPTVAMPPSVELREILPDLAEAPVYDIDYFLTSLNGDIESVRMLLSVFVSDHSDDVRRFKRVLPDSIEDAEKIIHSLKGVSGSIGAKKLHEITSYIDSTLKGGKVPTQESIDLLEAQMNAVLNAIQAFLCNARQ